MKNRIRLALSVTTLVVTLGACFAPPRGDQPDRFWPGRTTATTACETVHTVDADPEIPEQDKEEPCPNS